jgi:phosphatidyl-myo-inositol dimannoside synthase
VSGPAAALSSMRATTSAHLERRIVGLFPALHGVGGIQQASRLTAAALAEIAPGYGWTVDFLSLNDSPEHHAFALNGASISFSGFGRTKARFVLSAMARARAQTDIVIAAHPYLGIAVAQMKMLQPRLKTIVISHGIEVWQRLPVLRRKAFLTADLFIAPSRYTIQKIVETQGAFEQKTRRLPWPLSPDFLDLASHAEALTVPADFPRGLVVLATARLASDEKYKGVDQLIRAVSRLAPQIQPLQLAVIASGDDLPRHQRLAREVGISDRVRFFPGLSQAEIAACYSHSDVFALPSTGEGFGLVFLEAMAFGKPVIGAAAGGVTDIIEHEKNGLLVEPGNVDSLTLALERLLSNEGLRTELGRAGAESVRSQFQFGAFRARLEQILRQCGLASEENQ